ncbi:tyrosine-type recombinase/integrase [Novosphingobium mathurense]|uniref:Integrase n=1 Tax=Novosphingobium mathurense TaxID=428990 RepID=A0A1U6GXY5_9SPHN|nr:site-specific integrase [Novosphingobium mathurense]SLJ88346.1 Integrase [Novosphingobium mathurense]
MARHLNRLTVKQVQNAKKSGLLADGGGLYLSTTNGGRRWVYVFQWEGRRKEMGLGSANDVPLARARDKAAEARAMVADGINPIDARKAEQEAEREPDSVPTFGSFADSYIASVEEGWRNEKHRQQWRNSLEQHASCLRDKSVADVTTEDVLAALQPIWLTIPETANRVRGRIEKVLNAAKARGYRSQDSINPALWRGHLEILLPKRQRLSRGHHAAMPYAELPLFCRKLADRPAIAARALEFLILTAARSGEVLGARWGEVDGNLWTVPAERMKAGFAHTVTLPPAAVEILDSIGRGAPDAPIFKGRGKRGELSIMTIPMLMRRMKVDRYTVHGFRSAFKDWALDCTEFPDEISEEALAHVVGSKVRRAYRRGEALDRRRALMEAWSSFVTTAPVPVQVAA